MTEGYNICDYGALENDCTLVEVSHQVGAAREFNVKKQTKTGVAIQQAIDAAGAAGGGVVLIPPGVWYVYSYLQVTTPNVEIRGQGAASVLKACPDAPTAHGYGILVLGFGGQGQPKDGFTGLVVRDLKLDGSISSRGKPAAEFQMYNLAVYGDVTHIRIQGIVSIESGIDCLLLNYGNNDKSGAVVSDCIFSDAFRNTVSLVSGWHINIRDCVFAGGGVPFGGTNPRYCLDIEPNLPDSIIQHVRFSGCTFQNARNVAAGMVWCQDVRFDNCLFAAGKDTVQGIIFHASYCDVVVTDSTFDGAAFPGCYLRQESLYGSNDPLLRRLGLASRLSLNNSYFNRVGAEIQGHTAIVRNNHFLNSGKALFVPAPFAVVENNILTNCGWADPNGGRYAALCIGYNSDKRRRYVVSGNLVRFNEDYLDQGMLSGINPGAYYGVYIQYINAEIQLLNNRAEGFYRFPDAKGQARNDNLFRDWHAPGLPPEDKKEPSRVVLGNSYGGPNWLPETPFK